MVSTLAANFWPITSKGTIASRRVSSRLFANIFMVMQTLVSYPHFNFFTSLKKVQTYIHHRLR